MKDKIFIKQKGYANITIDTREKDVLVLFAEGKSSVGVVHIERKNINKIIDVLLKELK